MKVLSKPSLGELCAASTEITEPLHGVEVTSRFDNLLRKVVGKRLTYRQLCYIDDAGFMGLE